MSKLLISYLPIPLLQNYYSYILKDIKFCLKTSIFPFITFKKHFSLLNFVVPLFASHFSPLAHPDSYINPSAFFFCFKETTNFNQLYSQNFETCGEKVSSLEILINLRNTNLASYLIFIMEQN